MPRNSNICPNTTKPETDVLFNYIILTLKKYVFNRKIGSYSVYSKQNTLSKKLRSDSRASVICKAVMQIVSCIIIRYHSPDLQAYYRRNRGRKAVSKERGWSVWGGTKWGLVTLSSRPRIVESVNFSRATAKCKSASLRSYGDVSVIW